MYGGGEEVWTTCPRVSCRRDAIYMLIRQLWPPVRAAGTSGSVFEMVTQTSRDTPLSFLRSTCCGRSLPTFARGHSINDTLLIILRNWPVVAGQLNENSPTLREINSSQECVWRWISAGTEVAITFGRYWMVILRYFGRFEIILDNQPNRMDI